ncbi:MAG: hypothetical protein PHV59_07000 [Victivallales bacterium]|nr:hypothetical protein [Victivallales bacterium]
MAKFQAKMKIYIQAVSLLLTVFVAGGRELLHPFFHPEIRNDAGYCYCSSDKSGTVDARFASGQGKVFCDHECPLCSCPAAKYINSTSVPESTAGNFFSFYPVSAEKNVFRNCMQAFSRGPPSAGILSLTMLI